MNILIIESMLLSKDEEVRKLAFNYIKTNYDINFAVFYSRSKNKFYFFGTDSDYFMYMNVILFNINSISEGYIKEFLITTTPNSLISSSCDVSISINREIFKSVFIIFYYYIYYIARKIM